MIQYNITKKRLNIQLNKGLNESTTISIIGLGRLGTPLATIFASCGLKTVGVDISKDRIKVLKEGRVDLYEKATQGLFERYTKNLIFTEDFELAILNTNITFIIVPTPSEKDGPFSLKYIFQVLQDLGRSIGKKKKHTP